MTKDQSLVKNSLLEAGMFVKWAVSALLDSAFIAFWAFIQWGANRIIGVFPLENLDLWVLAAFRIMFAITTLIPVIIYIYEDVMVMAYRAARRVREERAK
jgi:hypothetical protein